MMLVFDKLYLESLRNKKQLLIKKINQEKKELQELYRNFDMDSKVLEKFLSDLNIGKVEIQPSSITTIKTNKSSEKQIYIDKRNKLADTNFYSKIKPLIDLIPDSNGSRYFNKKDLNIAIITDEFMFNYYKDAANFYYLSKHNYKKVLEEVNFDLFMFVTGWKGMDNNDWAGIASDSEQKSELINAIEYVKSKNIPTVFQSIEDPSNYIYFIDIAKKCEYVFTSAEEVVKDYKRDCGHENVWVLEFGVNPLFHNPIGFKNVDKIKSIFFAGSWASRYKERCDDMIEIFDGVYESDYELKILDRNYEFDNVNNFFPEKYLKSISPGINHEELQKVHKLFDWAINLNSIKYSKTMCAMRVYELQAIGNNILSNYSEAVQSRFPNIYIINKKEEVPRILSSLNDKEIYLNQIRGIRNVMTDCTVFDRFDDILLKCKIPTKKIHRNILVVLEDLSMVNQFEEQSYDNKKFILKSDLNESIYKEYDFVTFFSNEITYGAHYLQDMINAFKYTDSDYITKNAFYKKDIFEQGVEHNYTNLIKDKFITVFWRESFKLNDLLNMDNNFICENGYSIDYFEIN